MSFLHTQTSYLPIDKLYSFALQFPKAAYAVFDFIQSSVASASQLSPKAQANLQKLSLLTYKGGVYLFKKTQKVYVYLMKIPKRPIQQWSRPYFWMLYPLCSLVLFTFPVESEWSSETLKQLKEYNKTTSKNKKSLVFVSNRNVYSLDVIPLVCLVYIKTGLWLRCAVDDYRMFYVTHYSM